MTDPRKITEKVFQETIRKAALQLGWRYYHPWISMKSTEGYPDCTLVHAKKKRLIFAELKVDGKVPTEKQQEWLDDLNAARSVGIKSKHEFFEVYVWRPSDMDVIWEILRK